MLESGERRHPAHETRTRGIPFYRDLRLSITSARDGPTYRPTGGEDSVLIRKNESTAIAAVGHADLFEMMAQMGEIVRH